MRVGPVIFFQISLFRLGIITLRLKLYLDDEPQDAAYLLRWPAPHAVCRPSGSMTRCCSGPAYRRRLLGYRFAALWPRPHSSPDMPTHAGYG
jgi:hypothetical protein